MKLKELGPCPTGSACLYSCVDECFRQKRAAEAPPEPSGSVEEAAWMIRRLEVLQAQYRSNANNHRLGSFKQSEALAFAESLAYALELTTVRAQQAEQIETLKKEIERQRLFLEVIPEEGSALEALVKAEATITTLEAEIARLTALPSPPQVTQE